MWPLKIKLYTDETEHEQHFLTQGNEYRRGSIWPLKSKLYSNEYLSLPIIERIYKKMTANLQFSSIQVDKDIIIDGHHRYLASLLSNYSLEFVPGIKSVAKTSIDWTSVKLLEEDWDTPARIKLLNEMDARYEWHEP